jgi:hypothetical protein
MIDTVTATALAAVADIPIFVILMFRAAEPPTQ